MTDYDPAADTGLDAGIAPYVRVLREAGVETFESCQAGPGHSYREPGVRFNGEPAEGFRALGVALRSGLPVYALRRVWRMDYGEPTGPWWELVFWKHAGEQAPALPFVQQMRRLRDGLQQIADWKGVTDPDTFGRRDALLMRDLADHTLREVPTNGTPEALGTEADRAQRDRAEGPVPGTGKRPHSPVE